MRQYFGTSAPVFVRASGQRTKRQDTTQFTVALGVPPVPMHAIPGGFLKIITTEIYGRRGSRSVRLATPSVCQAADVEN